ncbi:uncharacterized protein EDB93DRAFT_1258675 [Suillus bovinus]|uniref:uncharacterized protein n=1 Tax=Suillus bovinus TaxID=48563 RepID=UPI001B885910|nr:uncharacterized protein EDB93DRAFT_1258675 [Suillus bovinus]KAG2124587.1 hypothetical protein EDB93DRAFT_1258675 [Suillus bovinus]
MAPHLHHVPSSTSTQAQAGGKTTAMIKDEEKEKSVEVFSGSGADTDAIRVRLDPQIHPVDIAQFTQFGFDKQVKQLANHLGFQPVMIRNVYKHVSNFKCTKKIVKSMHTAAMECAKAEIEGQEVEELYASDKSENDSTGIMSTVEIRT